jgi:phosphate transport system substrate-binding protein
MRRTLHLLATAALLAIPALSLGVEIRIGAGAAPTENVLKPIEDAFEKASGHQLTILATGPKNAMQDLEKGQVDAAAAGLSMEDWLALMQKEGVPVADPKAIQATVIGQDRIAILTHPSNPVKSLTADQLKGLFTGTIGNWQELGGPDAPVIVVWGKLMSGTNSLFQKRMMGGAEPGGNVLEATTADDVRQMVAANAEAVGIGPMAILDASVASPATPEIARPITLATKGAPSPAVKALLDYIAGPGQAHIKH